MRNREKERVEEMKNNVIPEYTGDAGIFYSPEDVE